MESLIKDLLESNRNQRHDFLNHLQVIWGFIKIKREDKAVEYVQEVTEYLQGLKELNNFANIELAADMTAKILELGLQRGFSLFVPSKWQIEEDHITRVRGFLNDFWEKLTPLIFTEDSAIKLVFQEGNIILDVHNIGEDFSWQPFRAIGTKYGLKTAVHGSILTFFVEG